MIKSSDITKPFYNKVSLLVLALFIQYFYPDETRHGLQQVNFHGPKVLVIARFHCMSFCILP